MAKAEIDNRVRPPAAVANDFPILFDMDAEKSSYFDITGVHLCSPLSAPGKNRLPIRHHGMVVAGLMR